MTKTETTGEIFEKLKDILAYQLGVSKDQITLDSLLDDDLGADPTMLIPIAMAIEAEFDIEVPDEVVDYDFRKVRDVRNFIICQLSRKEKMS